MQTVMHLCLDPGVKQMNICNKTKIAANSTYVCHWQHLLYKKWKLIRFHKHSDKRVKVKVIHCKIANKYATKNVSSTLHGYRQSLNKDLVLNGKKTERNC